MGLEEVELKTDESQESSYQIISYHDNTLPEEYKNVIMDPFLKSLRYGNDYFKLIEKEKYFQVYPKYIQNLISRPQTIIRIAVLDKDTILGWSMSENEYLHYVWVKKEVWMQGIAKALIPKNIKKFSHITNKGLSIWAKDHYQHLIFDPFI